MLLDMATADVYLGINSVAADTPEHEGVQPIAAGVIGEGK